jgi:hypothetical protein
VSGMRADMDKVVSAYAEVKLSEAMDNAQVGPPGGKPVGKAMSAEVAIENMDAEVRAMALKYGVPGSVVDDAIRHFAKFMVGHAGRRGSVHRLSHWKNWWKGYSAGHGAGFLMGYKTGKSDV